ncbi:alpha/beta hydrolase [Limnoglobus roseus]|uniref:Alpha/beta hydrolase n=1 Tax=Limnoglobus roseus TaxID=2598579 RepID=A0A5C1AP73_9BACT|nr:alpha/beta hydrolase [Limnoglobus roseus]QEL20385.1 alpha/beta hydrolase [Limnoglobus roseus]
MTPNEAAPVQQPPARGWRRFIRRWLIFLALLWIGSVIMLKALENRFVYPGDTAAQSWMDSPAADTEDVWLKSADSTMIHGWFFPKPDAANVFVVAHGNGGNLSHRGRLAVQLRDLVGAAVLLFEYPGYGKSNGSPSEQGCYAAGDAAVAWLIAEKKVPANRLVLMGESLGGGVATEMATRHEHKALVLTKTFTSLPAAAKNLFPVLPTHTLMSNRYDNLAKLPKVRTPVFIAHGTADTLVPFRHAEELFAAANEPKELHRLEGHDHNAMFSTDFFVALKAFLNQHAK